VNDGALTVVYRDDKAKSKAAVTSDFFSPHTYWKKQDASGAAVYNWSGWFDGSYNDAAVKRYLTLTNSKNRLILGPWEHGGSFNAGHTNPGRSGFDHIGEALRFFDHHMKGWDTGISKENQFIISPWWKKMERPRMFGRQRIPNTNPCFLMREIHLHGEIISQLMRKRKGR